ncbi:extracellular solute-binding protein [Streptococcus sp. DD12]|uniref:extracellular solute-binding protein n=1 Tax=Streptococcus sp. DD12 TaxID=1777880 RepID=UPI00079CCDC9|nr:extracellular solute-binding protein [Streptococcus sp. DD12]KXT76288.1 Maltose/maltodextrin ABC transporter, substrate binding periplasmic protein MalE [Streptococcus sp. DD12]
MKNWKKVLLAGTSLLVAGSLLVACSNSKDSKASASEKTLKLWVPTGAKTSYADTIKNFEKETGYKVDMVEMEDPNAQENLTKDASTAADVFSLPHDQLGKLVESGAIQEIPEKYRKEITQNDTEQAALGAQYKGKTYAFPYGIESQVTYYNKSKLTADDVKSYETITSKGKFGGNLKEVNAYATAPLFLSVGDTLFGASGEDVKGTNWGNEAGVNVLKFIAAQKSNSGFVNVDAANTLSKFGDGSIDAFQSGPWDYAAAEKAVGKDNLGIAIYPTVVIGGKTVQQKAFLGVKLYAVNQTPSKGNADRIAASYKLAQALTSKDSQENQFSFEGRHIIPANKEVQASQAVQNDTLAQAVITMGSSDSYTTVMPKLSQMSVFWTESAAILSDVYNGKISEDQYLAKLQQFDKDLASAK